MWTYLQILAMRFSVASRLRCDHSMRPYPSPSPHPPAILIGLQEAESWDAVLCGLCCSCCREFPGWYSGEFTHSRFVAEICSILLTWKFFCPLHSDKSLLLFWVRVWKLVCRWSIDHHRQPFFNVCTKGLLVYKNKIKLILFLMYFSRALMAIHVQGN